MKIRKAKTADAAKLTQLTIKSKGYWGYSPQQLEEWREELTITPHYISTNQVFVVLEKDAPIGFYAFAPINRNLVKLNFLFVDPIFIGKGYGRFLMVDFLNRIKGKATKVTLDADPNAEIFYKKLGFKVAGQLQSTIKNRFLPIMELDLTTFISV
ncbi:GNAT family N-acetyltransferase [Maribacter sp. 2210JD10-5]|uniref:GNAT family N-acetyltransferase n=1 Tax=Maribacter sp. 2210JD10-5 TaxID=3386272 RepID=UPI0039BCD363